MLRPARRPVIRLIAPLLQPHPPPVGSHCSHPRAGRILRNPPMPHPTRVLLWTDTPGAYLEAIAAAGLAERVAVEALPRKDTPDPGAARRHRGDARLGRAARLAAEDAGAALGAGADRRRGKLDGAAGPAAVLTLTCARGTHRELMPENILGALFHLTKPYAAIVEDQKQHRWTRRMATPLNGQTLGILGLGEIGQEVARLATAAAHARDRHQAARRRGPQCRRGVSARSTPTRCWRSPTSSCCCCRQRRRPRTSSTPSAWRR